LRVFDNWHLEEYRDLPKTKVTEDSIEPHVKEFHDPLRVNGVIKGIEGVADHF